MPEIIDHKLTEDDYNILSSSLVLDLMAYFGLLQEDLSNLIDEAHKNRWTFSELFDKIEKLIKG